LISEIHAGSPAENAGLRAGDIVIDFGGATIPNVDALHRELSDDKIGVAIPIRVLRNGEPRRLIVVPADPAATAP
jgi:serine protease Do